MNNIWKRADCGIPLVLTKRGEQKELGYIFTEEV